jgi:DNA-binding transcriptional LysR family regulator
LTPELLKTFVVLCHKDMDTGKVLGELKINQPSLSKRLRYFKEVGPLVRQPWLDLKGKTWLLTDEGRRVLPMVEDLLRRYDQMIRFIEAAEPAELTVGCGREAAGTLVLAAVRRFRDLRPDARFHLLTRRGAARIEGVSNGLIDLALVTHDEDQIETIARRSLHVQVLLDDPLMLVSARGVPWEEEFQALSAGRVSAKALTPFPLILPEPDSGLREQLAVRFRQAEVERKLNVVLEIGGWETLLAYVRAEVGVALVPASVVARKGSGLLVKKPQSALTPPHRLRLICRQRPGTNQRDLSELGEHFYQALSAEARALEVLIQGLMA